MPVTKIILNDIVDKRRCETCGKSNSTYTCDGCQSIFCQKHLLQHRQDLAYQFEDVMHNHELLGQDIEGSSNEYNYLRRISKWEQNAIQKVRSTAERAREEVRQILAKTKKRFMRISRAIALDLKASYKADDFQENDLKRWMTQLNDLRREIQSSDCLQLIEDQQSSISLIKIIHRKLPDLINHDHKAPHSNPAKERFLKAAYPASVHNDGLIAKHIGDEMDYGHVIGTQFYSRGCHTIRLKILRSTTPYNIFFGCISSERIPSIMNYNSSFAVGWFGHNEIYQHGIWNNNARIHHYNSDDMQTNDIVCLTFDCDKKNIALFHERTNKTYKLAVNTDKAPFPWQLLVVLVNEGDSVKILPNH
ncbi:unnamed protein product [Adineta ricciae]|uniref:B box-type domain-containing protein n=1 Tax=Adineta ricciae TaxID=249248 RepID=A0A813QFC3_ADIRI|nr:unnamed protein product [Adineta ricciae]